MPAKYGRLLRRADFARVAGQKRKWAAPGLVLQAAPMVDAQPSPAPYRVGFTASKRVGNAVQRNRARRRLRAAVADVMPVGAAPGFDFVVIARPETLSREFRALERDLEVALQRLRAWRGTPKAVS